VARQLQSLSAQSERFGKLWAGLFGGLKLEPVLEAVSILVGMFDKANPLAQAMGGAIKAAFDPIAGIAVRAAYAVEAFALGVAIQATRIYLAVRPALDAFDGLGLSLDTALFAGKAFVVVAGGIAAALGAVLALALAVPVAIAAIPLTLYTIGSTLVEWARTTGVSLVQGLIEGVTGMVGAVVSAVTGTVGAGITAAKDLLGIASPSKVFAEIGTNTVEGFTNSVDAGASEAAGSMANLVGESAQAPAQAAASAPARAGGSGATVTIGSVTITGVEGAADIAPRLGELITRYLEDQAASLSGATT
jgi:hypothetical protein